MTIALDCTVVRAQAARPHRGHPAASQGGAEIVCVRAGGVLLPPAAAPVA